MKIISGQYEKGTGQQQEVFRAVFGERDTQYRFDLYFHWYNILHELGHCVTEAQGLRTSPVKEEMLVNSFAVAYWNQAGQGDRVEELSRLLEERLALMPVFVPGGLGLVEYYESVWGQELLGDVARYGHFQFSSVREAIREGRDLKSVLAAMGLSIGGENAVKGCRGEICAQNAHKVLSQALKDLQGLGLPPMEVELELVDDPTIQCAQ
ncbi:MAG: hypothetical protein HFE94_04355 [Acutalibacter sp.]|nr:hypothetical protein [Acutalibacter sp.]